MDTPGGCILLSGWDRSAIFQKRLSVLMTGHI